METKAVVVHDARTSVWARIAASNGLDVARCREVVLNTLMPRRDGKLVPSEADMAAALLIADKYSLNPFAKEIYFTPGRGGGLLCLVGIDGWCTLANRNPACDGFDFEDILDGSGELVAVKARIYRKDRAHPVEVTEYMVECKRPTDPWRQSPRRLLRHRALAQGIRYAFGIGGIMLPDEAEAMADPKPREASQRSLKSLDDAKARLVERAEIVDEATGEIVGGMSREESDRLDREAADAEAKGFDRGN